MDRQATRTEDEALNAPAFRALLAARRTRREFTARAVDSADLLDLLQAAQGIDAETKLRTAPSAGARYPLGLYVAAGTVDGLAPGLYRYEADHATLDLVGEGDLRPELQAAALEEQGWVGDAALVIVVTANLADMLEHFAHQPPAGERGARYAWMESGALAQNVHLLATTLGLGMVLVGGFDDHAVGECLGLPEGHGATAMLCVGHRADAGEPTA